MRILLASILALAIVQPVLSQTVTIPLIDKTETMDKDNPSLVAGSHQFQAQKLLSEGKTKEAEAEVRITLDKATKLGDQEIINSCKFGLAKIYRADKRYDDSLKLYQEVLDYYAPQPGSGWHQAMILNNIGELYRSSGQPDKALSTLLEAKSKTEEKSPNYCAILENLGYTYLQLKKLTEAEAAFRSAADVAKNSDKRSYADCLCTLTLLVYKETRIDEARQLLDQALSACSVAYPPDAPQFLAMKKIQSEISSVGEFDTAMKTGIADMKANRYSEGLTKFQNARKIIESQKDSDGPNALAALLWEGNAYLALKQYSKAEETENKAIQMYHRIPMNQPEVLETLQMALKLAQRGKLQSH